MIIYNSFQKSSFHWELIWIIFHFIINIPPSTINYHKHLTHNHKVFNYNSPLSLVPLRCGCCFVMYSLCVPNALYHRPERWSRRGFCWAAKEVAFPLMYSILLFVAFFIFLSSLGSLSKGEWEGDGWHTRAEEDFFRVLIHFIREECVVYHLEAKPINLLLPSSELFFRNFPPSLAATDVTCYTHIYCMYFISLSPFFSGHQLLSWGFFSLTAFLLVCLT